MATLDKNKQIVSRFIEETAAGNYAVLNDLLDSNAVLHQPVGKGTFKGPDEIKQNLETWRNAFPDIHVSVDDMVAEGNKVVVRTTLDGTHKGPLGKIEPTHKQVRWPAATFFYLTDSKIMEIWDDGGEFEFLKQLDLLPPLAAQ